MPKVQEFVDKNGQNHYRAFFMGLPAQAAAKVTVVKARMESGNTSGLKSLGGGLAEWRLDWGPGLRIYVHQDGEALIILMAGSDKGDQQKTIAKAHGLVDEYKSWKKAAGGKTAKKK